MSTEARTLDRTATRFVAAEAERVFALVTDPARLPEWNAAIVAFALHPATFWRRTLLARMRALQLRRREIPASLRGLATLATTEPDR